MLVGKPVAAVVVELSEAIVLLGSYASVVAAGGAVVVGAKVSWVGTSIVVASSLPVGTILWGAWVVVREGVVGIEDTDTVGIGTTTAVVDSTEEEARVSVDETLETPVVMADSTEPDVVDDADDIDDSADPEMDETPVVDDASVAPEVVVALDSPDGVEAPEASEVPPVVDTLPVSEDWAPDVTDVTDVASPEPAVTGTLDSLPVEIPPIGTMVLPLEVEVGSVELLEGTVDGFSVG
jgi:hypothetical protein